MIPERLIPPKLDWSQIIEDLHQNGCSPYRIAITLQIADCTVRNWMSGGEPGYGKGRALLRLHSGYCGAGLTMLRVEEGEIVE